MRAKKINRPAVARWRRPRSTRSERRSVQRSGYLFREFAFLWGQEPEHFPVHIAGRRYRL
jgi:hypothetical protein